MDIKTELDIDPLHIPMQIKIEPPEEGNELDHDHYMHQEESENTSSLCLEGIKATSQIKTEPLDFDASQFVTVKLDTPQVEPVECDPSHIIVDVPVDGSQIIVDQCVDLNASQNVIDETMKLIIVEHYKSPDVEIKQEEPIKPIEFEQVLIKTEVNEESCELANAWGEETEDCDSTLQLNTEIDLKEEAISHNQGNSTIKQRKEPFIETKPIKCNMCLEIFKNSTILVQHKKKVHPCRLSPCDYCNKVLKTYKQLYEHLKVVHSYKLFHCTECKYIATSKKYLLYHKRYHHKNVKEEYKCDFCDKVFKQYCLVREHYTRMHANPDKVFTCEICNNHYKEASGLRRHRKNKHGDMIKQKK